MAWKEGVLGLAKKGVEMAWEGAGSRFALPPAWAESRLQVTRPRLWMPELRMRKLWERVWYRVITPNPNQEIN